jgi:DNA-binding transcriptional ArsR family regulator
MRVSVSRGLTAAPARTIVNLVVQQQHLDLAFAALADPVRRAVLARLRQGGTAVSTLAADHAISLPAFMKHVRTLERAGLVTTTKTGRIRTCRLCEPGLAAAEAWLRTHRTFWERQLESLARHVEPPAREAQTWTPPPSRKRSKSGASSPRHPRASTTPGRRPRA